MGTLVGHVAPGLAFFFLGFWHLFNHTKLHATNPSSYTSLPWFPTSKIRHLELFLIMLGSSMSVAMELFIGPDRHQPLDPDGTISSNHLHNFEHSSISLSFFVYAAFAVLLDRHNNVVPTKRHDDSRISDMSLQLTQLVGAVAFAQQLLLFHLHSADHMGVEGQYHLLLQLVILVSLLTTLLGIGFSRSFLISFLRSLSLMFQGVWFVVMGYMLWTPGLIPKGCYIHLEEGHEVVRCSTEEALHRAKSLVNIEFSWLLIVMTVTAVAFYMLIVRVYDNKVPYWSLGNENQNEDGDQGRDLLEDDVESQEKRKLGDSGSFVHMGKAFAPIDMER